MRSAMIVTCDAPRHRLPLQTFNTFPALMLLAVEADGAALESGDVEINAWPRCRDESTISAAEIREFMVARCGIDRATRDPEWKKNVLR